MPKVSVIVPFYNVEKYIEKCIKSLLNQTLDDIEIILVNDGSKDNSASIAKRYWQENTEKIVYLEKENGGLGDARNYGIPYAKGEYIAFIDSDDYVEKDMYKQMLKKAEEEHSDMVECDFWWEYSENDKKEDIGILYEGKHEALVNARVVAWNKLIRKDIINKYDIKFPKRYRYEDVEFFYKLNPYLKKISFVKKPFIHYIQRSNSLSNLQNERTREIFYVLDNVINYYKENNLYDEYKEELEYVYTRYLLCSSFLRIVKIIDRKTRTKLLDETWEKLNTTFPNWKSNRILKSEKTCKNLYIRSVNKITYKIYSKIFRIKK